MSSQRVSSRQRQASAVKPLPENVEFLRMDSGNTSEDSRPSVDFDRIVDPARMTTPLVAKPI
ncbi:hypothetical protein [Luteibacter sp. UNCMF331Sha3.1]|uniref:hypothetical protein n=1 Tax=Luteibacter sp. UNCMF331Sha3.1 TaxID=1502760 RepID=UPI0011142C70|nr:hypothetical protein [Luteibacter sp. UNCMF331Sha3.1]